MRLLSCPRGASSLEYLLLGAVVAVGSAGAWTGFRGYVESAGELEGAQLIALAHSDPRLSEGAGAGRSAAAQVAGELPRPGQEARPAVGALGDGVASVAGHLTAGDTASPRVHYSNGSGTMIEAFGPGSFTSGELAAFYDGLAAADNPLAGVINTESLALGGAEVPEGRHRAETYHNETPFIRAMRQAIESGVIDENTLVLSNTGHGFTVSAVMVEAFGSDVITHLPADYWANDAMTHGNLGRLRDQAQTFAPVIEAGRGQGRLGVSTVWNVDLHIDYPISDKGMPTAQALRDYGFERVVLALELGPIDEDAAVYRPGSYIDYPKLVGPYYYVDSLLKEMETWPEEERMPIVRFGADWRHITPFRFED